MPCAADLDWVPVACPAEGFNAPIGHVCLAQFAGKGSKPCLRTLGGEVLKKREFLSELGMEDVPLRLLVAVRPRDGGGWGQLGSLPDLAKAWRQGKDVVQLAAAAAAAAAVPAPARPAAPRSPQRPVPAPAPMPARPPADELPVPPLEQRMEALHLAPGAPRRPQRPQRPRSPQRPLPPPAAAAAAPQRDGLALGPPPPHQPQPPQQRSPVPPAAAQLLPGSGSRRRSTLGCPACRSLRRAVGGAAAAAVECPLCYCEVDAEHTHLDCGHAACNPCLSNWLHAGYQRGQHPACQLPACGALLSAEDLEQGVLVLCSCPEVQRQRVAARLPPLDDPSAVYQRFTDLAAAAVARGAGGEFIECQRCRFRLLAEPDAPEDAPCPNCRVGQPIREAREAAARPKGIQTLEGGERVLYCPSCSFGPQQKGLYCNKLTCGGCKALLCWCCGEVIGEAGAARNTYDHFAGQGGGGKCPLYGLPGERPELAAGQVEAAQERAVQREQHHQALWDRIVHPAHDAVRAMRLSTAPDLQREDALWRRVAQTMHSTLERAFNQITDVVAAQELELSAAALSVLLSNIAQPQLAVAWPGWDVWDGIVASVMSAVRRALM